MAYQRQSINSVRINVYEEQLQSVDPTKSIMYVDHSAIINYLMTLYKYVRGPNADVAQPQPRQECHFLTLLPIFF